MKNNTTTIVCISDTHTKHAQISIPLGDILVHAGDFTSVGREREVREFGDWFRNQPHKHKIVIAGNHDLAFESKPNEAREWLGDGLNYLQDSGVEIMGWKFWGSPYQPEFYDWAFNLPRDDGQLAKKWDLIPHDTEVLVTHGPPQGILDETDSGDIVGCVDLWCRREGLPKLKAHIFGHIHEGYGVRDYKGVTHINASSLNSRYQPTNPPIILTLRK